MQPSFRDRSLALLAQIVAVTRPPENFYPQSVVILQPCGLGDVLLATPVITAVRQAWPQARIDFATGSSGQPALAGHPELRRIVDTGRVGQSAYSWSDVRRLANELRAQRYDLCLTLDRSPRVGIVPLLAGIPLRAGLDSAGRGFAHNVRVPVPAIRYEPELYLDVARAVIRQTPRAKFEFTPSQFYPSAADQAHVTDLLAGVPATHTVPAQGAELQATQGSAAGPLDQIAAPERGTATPSSTAPLIAIHAGDGANPYMILPAQRWPPERFAAIADRLVEKYAAQVILTGSSSEAAITRAVREAMRQPVRDLTGRLTIGQLGALCQRCVLVLGNDSDVTRLANAVDTPVVALYGPSDPRIYGPYDARSLALWHEVGCNPCAREGRSRPDCCSNGAIEAISVEECWQAVEIVLRRQGVVARP